MTSRVDQVDSVLAKLWDQQVAAGHPAHARTVTLVAICPDADAAARAHAVTQAVMPSHPGRAIVVVLRPNQPAGTRAEITAEAELVCAPTPRTTPCGERVTLEVRGEPALAWTPPAIERLRADGARTYLWWMGDLPDQPTLFHELLPTADTVVVNSADLDLRDLVELARLAERAALEGRFSVADLGWVRLRGWQELLARFFDDPAVRSQLAGARRMTIATAPFRDGGAVPEPAGAHAGLFAGWFCERIGADAAHARWSVGAQGEGEAARPVHEVVMPRGRRGAAASHEFTVRFETVARDDVPPGALLRVELLTDDGSCFEISRAEDPLVLGWEGHCQGAVIPHAVIRARQPDDARLLARLLESPVRDRLYESGLATVARLLAPYYAGLNS